jgi:hypothetical protein
VYEWKSFYCYYYIFIGLKYSKCLGTRIECHLLKGWKKFPGKAWIINCENSIIKFDIGPPGRSILSERLPISISILLFHTDHKYSIVFLFNFVLWYQIKLQNYLIIWWNYKLKWWTRIFDIRFPPFSVLVFNVFPLALLNSIFLCLIRYMNEMKIKELFV